MSFKNSNQTFSHKRKHNESPIREAGEIRNSDESRHSSITSHSSPKYKFSKQRSFNNNNHRDQQGWDHQKYSNSVPSLEISVDKCISKMIQKEIERNKSDKVIECDEMKVDIKKLKDEYSTVFTQLNHVKTQLDGLKNDSFMQQQKNRNESNYNIDAKFGKMQTNLKNEIIMELTKIFENKISVTIETALKEQNDKIEHLKNTIDEINKKFNNFEQQIEDGRKSEALNIPTNIIENTIAAVMEEKLTEKQKELTLKEVHIPRFTGPKWLVPEEKCNELHKFCQGQVAKFLSEYLPLLYDLPEIITPLKRDRKREEAQAVAAHFWKNTPLTMDLIKREIEKEHSAQRYKTSRKIYLGLKNVDGVIMSNKGAIFECIWNPEKKKYIPKSEIPDESNSSNDDGFEWQIPRELQKMRYEKGKDYIIVAKNDDTNQTRIYKIDLSDFNTELLYTKRKYGNT